MTTHRIITSFFEPKDLGALIADLRAEPDIELYTNPTDDVPDSDDQTTRLTLTRATVGPNITLSTDRTDFSMEILELITPQIKPSIEVITIASTNPHRDSMTVLFTDTGSIEEVSRYRMDQAMRHAMNIADR